MHTLISRELGRSALLSPDARECDQPLDPTWRRRRMQNAWGALTRSHAAALLHIRGSARRAGRVGGYHWLISEGRLSSTVPRAERALAGPARGVASARCSGGRR